MAKIIELNFTDGQWELIKAHYATVSDGGLDVDCTEESFAFTIKLLISRKIASVMANKAAEANQNVFDV